MTYQKFLKHGVQAFLPTKAPVKLGTGGKSYEGVKWLEPLCSGRQYKVYRKKAIREGTYGSWDTVKGGWLPEWDNLKLMAPPSTSAPSGPGKGASAIRPHKLHIRERNREERYHKIKSALKEVDKKLKEHKETLQELKPKPGIETLIKKVTAKR